MGSKQASAVLHGEFLGKKGSDRVHAVGQKLAGAAPFGSSPLSSSPFPFPGPGVWPSLTWEGDGLCFLLVMEGILDEADHITHSSICDQKRCFHAEEPVSVLGL